MATPSEAAAVSVPPRVAPPGLLASATVTVPSNEESRLPELSSASTVRPKGLPAVMLAGGCWVTTSCDVVRVATPIALVLGIGEPEVAVGARRDRHRAGTGQGIGVLGDGVGRRVDTHRSCAGISTLGEPEVAVGARRDPAGAAVATTNSVMASVVGLIIPTCSAARSVTRGCRRVRP